MRISRNIIVVFLVITVAGCGFKSEPLPDENLLMFRTERGVDYIPFDCVFASDGEACKPTPFIRGPAIHNLHWEKGGQQAWAEMRKGNRYDFYAFDNQTTNWEYLTTFDWIESVAWSPYEDIIALSGTQKSEFEQVLATDNRLEEEHIYVIRDGTQVNVTRDLWGMKSDLIWLDVNTILFELDTAHESEQCGWYTVTLDTKEIQKVKNRGCNTDPQLSPDRSQLVWSEYETIYVGNLEGTQQRELVALDSSPQQVEWSSNGESLVFVERLLEAGIGTQIQSVSINDGIPHLVYQSDKIEYSFLYSVDGQDYIVLYVRDNWGEAEGYKLISLSDGALIDINPILSGTEDLPEQVWIRD